MLLAFSLFLSHAQDAPKYSPDTKGGARSTTEDQASKGDHAPTQDDRLSVLAAALDSRVQRSSDRDCSHLVHAIYEQAGLPYDYASSSDLYAGIENFQRVKQPQPGDLVVWRGHVGIVIKPSEHIFFSLMSSGPGTDDYQARYWKGRGQPRFYRYVKSNSCADCESGRHNARRLLDVKR
jgi:hypothetical protein